MKKPYEIGIKYYCGETSDHHTENIVANNKTEALKSFAKKMKIEKPKIRNYGNWQWWEGDWLGTLRYIKIIAAQKK